MTDPFQYIRDTFRVPVGKGVRVEYSGGRKPKQGTITGTNGKYILMKLDGSRISLPFHPSWRMRYLDTGDDGV